MHDQIERWFFDNWRADFGAPSPPSKLNIVKIQSSGCGRPFKERMGKVVFLAFLPGAAMPFAVAKVPRSPDVVQQLTREYHTFQSIEGSSELSGEFKATVPAPLYFGEIGIDLVSIISAVRGRQFQREAIWKRPFRSGMFKRRLAAAVSWLGQFERFAAKGCEKVDFGELTANVVEEFAGIPGVRSEAVDELRSISNRASNAGITVQKANQHGDFTLSNISFRREGIGVIDFERFGIEKNPLLDFTWITRSLALSEFGLDYHIEPVFVDIVRGALHEFHPELSAHPEAACLLTADAIIKQFFFKREQLDDMLGSKFKPLVDSLMQDMNSLRKIFAR